MCRARQNQNFTSLGSPKVIWAISAVHADVEKLQILHDKILNKIKPGDRVVYMGNYMGYGEYAKETIDELLTFRRLVLALPGMVPRDFVYLRGVQDEMWDKVLQLQFAPNPMDVLLWMLGNGLTQTLYSYNLSPHDAVDACRQGVMQITKWTHSLRQAVRRHAGHEIFNNQLTRAAYTEGEAPYPMLFVHSGLKVDKDLKDQGDNLWWASKEFEAMEHAYKPYEKVVRGYDPEHKGVHMNCISATIDGGCGFGGSLVCAGFQPNGQVEDLYEVK